MLLNIYLASTGACIAVDVISTAAILKRLDREGYKYIKEEKSFAEKVVDSIKVSPYLALPVLNVIMSFALLFITDGIGYEKLKEQLIEKGHVVKKDSNIELNNNATIEARLHSIEAERDALLREKRKLQDTIDLLNGSDKNHINISFNDEEYKCEDYSKGYDEGHTRKI